MERGRRAYQQVCIYWKELGPQVSHEKLDGMFVQGGQLNGIKNTTLMV
jgi:hypothetical protein